MTRKDSANAAGRFRADVYSRTNTCPETIPPLRERLADIPLPLRHCVQRDSVRHGKCIPGVTEEALAALIGYARSGNIRELGYIVERAAAGGSKKVLK